MAHPSTSLIVVPSGAPAWVTSELLAETIRVWQPYYAQTLTVDDALEIILAAKRLLEALGQRGDQTDCIPM